MYNIAHKFPYLELRLLIAILISVFIIFVDIKFNVFFLFRNYIERPTYFFCYLYDKPNFILNYLSKTLTEYRKLILENDTLQKELFIKNSELLLLEHYKQENDKLYALLNAPIQNGYHKLITKVLFTNIGPYCQQIMINQGVNHNVYVGQPLVADVGIVGQVISTSTLYSRVLLISDPLHAVSVKLQRNSIHMILMGCGSVSELCAEYPDNFIDIKINDILVTSGLDGCFPEGYPVAQIFNIQFDSRKDCLIIQAKPMVNLEYLQYAILIWK